jgi:hypothetical protein
MAKLLFVILLILSIYIYATVPALSRNEINKTVVMIPNHISTAIHFSSEKIGEFRQNNTD